MLTLPLNTQTDLLVGRDHLLEQRRYVMTNAVTVGRRRDGRPDVSLVAWMSADGAQALVGGRLSLMISVAPSDAQVRAAGLDPANVAAMPWRDASVALHGPGFETAPVPVAFSADGGALVSCDLDALAFMTLREALEHGGTTPLKLMWHGAVDARLPGTHVRAAASRTQIERRLRASGPAHETTVVRSVVALNASVDIAAGLDPEVERALRDWALSELTRRFEQHQPLSISVDAADVVRWPLTLDSTLVLPDAQPIETHSLVLSQDSLPRSGDSTARVVGAFGDDVGRVDVEVQFKGSTTSLAFVDSKAQRLELGGAAYTWRSRIVRADGGQGAWSAWHAQAPASDLLIPIHRQARPEIEVVASGLDFGERWERVDVRLESSVDATSLAASRLDGTESSAVAQLGAADASGLRVRATFVARDGYSVQRDVPLEATQRVVVLHDPYDGHTLEITLIPSGDGWQEVAKSMVDLRFGHGAAQRDVTLVLDRLDASASWRVPLSASDDGRYQWRHHVSYNDGRLVSSDWQAASGAVQLIHLAAPDRRQLQVVAAFLAAGESVVVEIAQAGDQWSVELSEPGARTVAIGPSDYLWRAVWTVDGQQRAGPNTPARGDAIIVPPAS